MDADALLYTDEAAAIACVTPATIRQWAHRYPDLLPVRSRDWRRRPRYRLADILEVERATRIRSRYPTRFRYPAPFIIANPDVAAMVEALDADDARNLRNEPA